MIEIYKSARKHDICDQDIFHALRNPFAILVVTPGGDSDKAFVIGPTRAGNLIETLVIEGEPGRRLVIHAMPVRKSTLAEIRLKETR